MFSGFGGRQSPLVMGHTALCPEWHVGQGREMQRDRSCTASENERQVGLHGDVGAGSFLLGLGGIALEVGRHCRIQGIAGSFLLGRLRYGSAMVG